MLIIGQEKVKTELNFIIKEIEKGGNFNIALRAPSGYGKTSFLFICMNYLSWNNCFYTLGDTLDNEFSVDLQKRFIFIDEAHLIKNPEFLYPIMDSGNYSIFLATNEGALSEPLLNRCISLIFSSYSVEELEMMVKNYLRNFLLSPEIITKISSLYDNPRRIKKLCDRLSYIFRNLFVPISIPELDRILEVINIDESGLNPLERRYLSFIERIGRASLSTISLGTGIERNMVLTEIEPHLLYLGKIKITSRGREICQS